MISIEELAKTCGITRDGVNYHIKNLKKKGVVKRIGGDKGGVVHLPQCPHPIECELLAAVIASATSKHNARGHQ